MGQSLNIVAMLRTDKLRTAMSATCSDMNGTRFDLRVGTLQQFAGERLATQAPDVLLLDIDPRNSAEVELLRALVQSRLPEVPIVATAAGATLEDVRTLMRMGVVDVVPQPVQRSDLMAAIEYAARARRTPAHDPKGRVFSFLKGGGGVGATTIAVQAGCSLAFALGKKGATVCLLDFDVQSGTVALYLDLNDRVGLANLAESPERLDIDLLEGIMARHSSGLAVLAAPHEVIPLELLTPELVDHILEVMRRHFDFVLVDLPSSWTTWSCEALRKSDQVLLVTQMTVPGIRQARRQLDTLKIENLEDLDVKVVLNRFEKRWGNTIKIKEVEQALGRKIDFFVANDYSTVSEALDQGLALSEVRKRSKATKSILKMADALARAHTNEPLRVEPHLSRESRA